MRHRLRVITAIAVPLAVACSSPAFAVDDWPHWRGPERASVTAHHSGYVENTAWPGSAAWSVNVGPGNTAPVVVENRLYVLGHRDGEDELACIDLATGQTLWTQRYAAPAYGRHATGDQQFYSGPTASPEYDPDTGYLYTLSTDGDLYCWDTQADGEPVWSLNLYDEYDVPQRPQITPRPRTLRDYGYPTAPLLQSGHLLVHVGSPDHGSVIAFDPATGEPRWHSQAADPGGHAGGMSPIEIDGTPAIATLTATHLRVIATEGDDAGRTLASYDYANDFADNIATPAVDGDRVVISSRHGGEMLCLRVTAEGIEEIWSKPHVASGASSPAIAGGYLYFARRAVHAVDMESGELLWMGARFGEIGSLLVTGDERLIAWVNDGDLKLIDAATRSPEEYNLLRRHRGVLDAMAWPHVVLASGHLIVKDREGNVVAFNVGR